MNGATDFPLLVLIVAVGYAARELHSAVWWLREIAGRLHDIRDHRVSGPN
jgi:hypothetical protein